MQDTKDFNPPPKNLQINISIARHVMAGHFPDDPDQFSDTDEAWFYVKSGKLLIGTAYQISPDLVGGRVTYDHSWRYWNPCEDIADAWMVISRMEEKGFWAQTRTPFGLSQCNDGYWCGFTPHLATGWNGTPDDWTSAKTQPMAICLAALAAVGVEVS